MQQPSYLHDRLAYVRHPGATPGVVFFTGFKSDMTGAKALALESFCRAQGRAFLRFDYSGHGASRGAFEEGTIGQWRQDALAAIDALTEGPLVLAGSSMGGWIALLAALARPERVVGLLGIAAAPDFTEDLIWNVATPAQRQQMAEEGRILVPNCYGAEPYAITRALVEEGRAHLLLRAPIPLRMPVHLVHGMQDADVPYATALRLVERLESADVRLTLLKSGGHRLSEPDELAVLQAALGGVMGA